MGLFQQYIKPTVLPGSPWFSLTETYKDGEVTYSR